MWKLRNGWIVLAAALVGVPVMGVAQALGPDPALCSGSSEPTILVKDRADGVGASGNPKFSLLSILFGRKPPAQQVQISVARGTTVVPITVRYL